jgi:GYF domain 2
MADRQWYTAIGGQQAGPYSEEQFRDLIAANRVTADTLVWCTGMDNWTKAGAIPGLMSGAPRPPPLPLPASSAAAAAGAAEALATDVRVWPLIGRSIVVALGQLLILPAPWAVTSYYRWFVGHLQLPGGRRAAFTGRPEDIWYIFMLNALLGYAGVINNYLQLATVFLAPLFLLIILRWFVPNLTWQGQTAPLRFTGTYWPMLGWYVLAIISVISIIGWAWVTTAWTRWMCRHVEGGARRLLFTASGWGLLWRSIVFFLSRLVIVPIPWSVHWYVRWLVSQFAVGSAPA